MTDLSDVTFIIPVRIESEDRYRNLFLSCSYLLLKTNAKIIIKESGPTEIVNNVLEDVRRLFYFDNTRVVHVFEKTENPAFERTRLLNEMLMQSTTPIVVNYDCDVILPVSSYHTAAEMCRNDYDLVYPYRFGDNAQLRVVFLEMSQVSKFIKEDFSISALTGFDWRAEYGFCQFFKRESYINGFMENENFVAYAPEDSERFYRWNKLGYKIGRVDDRVYHLEHSRTNNSSGQNPYMVQNESLFERIKKMTTEELIDYYTNVEYLRKYKGQTE